jgi:dTDP-4-dehydrorhamnose reductase
MDLTTGVDITNVATFTPFFDAHPDAKALVHLAAFTDTAKANAESGDKTGICYKVNVEGTKNIAAFCKERGIHLIHVSTDFVFDGQQATPYLEDQPLSPIDWYGETKAMAEEVVKTSGCSYTIIRLSYPYRANFDLKPDLIKKIRAELTAADLPPMFSDTIITPTFVDDLARAFDTCVELMPSGTYHTVGSTSLSPYELARKVAVAYGFDPNLVKQGSLAEYLKTSTRQFAKTVAMSNAKATADLGLRFATIDEGLLEIKKQQGL